MKKLFFSLVAAIVAATTTYAQSTLVATLTHGENVSMYYGTYALRDAYNAAVSGDVINLSGGTFQAVDIKKAVTLRGAGIDAANPTYINSSFTINIPTSDTNRLSMEGVRCTETVTLNGTFSNAYFLKCNFYRINTQNTSSSSIKNTMFANCKITNGLYLYQTSTAQLVNCYVSDFQSQATAGASFVNCIITPTSGWSVGPISNSQLLNCIIVFPGSSSNSLPSTTLAMNCVSVNTTNNTFNSSQSNTGCTYGVSFADMFKDYTGTYTDAQTFELTNTAKTTYLGTDGTQVGLYGGVMPYNSTPSYPQITKMNVANKTTADGKLSVEIEVSAAQ